MSRSQVVTLPPDVSSRKPKLVQLISDSRSWHFFNGQAEFFTGKGFEVYAVSSPGPELEQLADHVCVHAIPFTRRIAPLRDLIAVWRVWKFLRRIRPDILHAHFSKTGIIAMVAGTLARTPIRIYHNHGMALSSARGWKWLLLWMVEKLSCQLAHQVIYVSASVQRDAGQMRICMPGKSRVIKSANGLESTARFARHLHGDTDRQQWRAALGIPEDAFAVGFVGRIFKVKGIEDLIGAWQMLAGEEPRLHLVLAGEPDEREPLSSWASSVIASEPRIHSAGFVQEVASFYPALDVLALPSYHEGLGYSLLEASAMELPVIGTRIPGIVDAIIDGVTGTLVDPGCPEQLAAAIMRYLRDPHLAETHGRAGRAFVTANLQQAAVWQSILSMYEQLLNERMKAFQQPDVDPGCTIAYLQASEAADRRDSSSPGRVLRAE